MYIKIKPYLKNYLLILATAIYVIFFIFMLSGFLLDDLSNRPLPFILEFIIFVILAPGLIPLYYTYKVNSLPISTALINQLLLIFLFFTLIVYHYFVVICLAHVYPNWTFWLVQVGEFILCWLFIRIIMSR